MNLHSSQTSGRASYAERIAMRREAVLATVRRRPGLTATQIGQDMGRCWQGYYGVIYNDLVLLKRRRQVAQIKVSTRTMLWVPNYPEPLLWEGED